MWILFSLIIIFLIYNSLKLGEHFENKKKIIIIGNGPSVLKNKIGNKIDQFDKVVRFNTFKNDSQFSDFVGTKTDFWFINAKNIRTRSPEIIKMMNNIDCEKIYIEQNPYDPKKKLLNYFPELKENNKVEFCDINVFNEIQKKHFNPYGMNPHPSLGLQGINLIAEKYQDYEIYIYGFDLFKDAKLHYMDNKTKKSDNNNIAHNTNKEVKFLEHLVEKYNIKKL